MKFNFKFISLQKLYINFCFLALINIFFSTDNIQAKSFSISDIEISTPFEINFDKNEIINDGFIQAFNQLILTIVQTKDQKKFDKISLNQIKGMVETFSILEEKFIDEMYYLSLSVSFNKEKVFNLLENKNIFPSLPTKKSIFFMPIILDENKDEILMFSESNLFKKWNLDIQNHHLLEYILPTEDLEDFNLIKRNSKNLENYNFKEIIKKYNSNDYIITIVFKNNKNIRVLNKINFDEKLNIKNLRIENLRLDTDKDMIELTDYLKSIFEDYWKTENEINTSVKLSLTVSIENNNNSKISKFENTLANVDLIYDYYIFKFDNKNINYKIVFNGSPNHFLKIMKNKGFEFYTQNKIWSVK